MREEFEKLVATGKINRQHVEPLVALATGGYCFHRSWGFGRITTVDMVFCRFTIDFPSRRGHTMDLTFAAESLKPIPGTHIYARKASDLESLRKMAAFNHLDLVKLVLESYGGKATLEQLHQVLVPDVIADDWKKWWEVVKREIKKDGHFILPAKKSDPIVYQVLEVSLQDRLMGEFRAAKGLKARIAVATEIQKNLTDLGDMKAAVTEIAAAFNAEINSHQRTQPAVALEAIFLRDELRATAGLSSTGEELAEPQIWALEPKFASLLEQIPTAKHRRALESFQVSSPDRWQDIVVGTINHVSAKLCGEMASILVHNGNLDLLKEALARLISQHQASSELLLWLAKERSDTFADILGPEVFRAMLTAMERDQFNEKRSNRLRDFILDDHELLVELIGSADLEVIKDLTRALQLSPCFDDMDKRSLLARIVKSYPTIQSLITGEPTRQEASLIVSWASLERRQNEYKEMVQKKIPANSKEIAIARSYGDLRENHEYKAAKEMQKLLMRQKAELESQLSRARGTDYADAKTDVVNIGTKVTVTELGSQHTETFSILGAWDSEPEKGIISYLSPIAQSLLNRKVGEEVEFELHGGPHRYRLDSIQSCALA